MRKFVFADEAGDFDFSGKQNSSRYFIVCMIELDSCDVGLELLRLRRDLLWDGVELGDGFHATTDSQYVRDRVFELLARHPFRVYAQILEKSKAQPQTRVTNERFYKHAWYFLLKHSMQKVLTRHEDQLMVTAASIGTKKTQVAFSEAVKDAVAQSVGKIDPGNWRTSFASAASDPCIQAADYCTWAIQRKWERGDARSHQLIRDRIVYEYDTWRSGTKHYFDRMKR